MQSLFSFAPLSLASGLSARGIRFDWLASFYSPIDGGRMVGGRRPAPSALGYLLGVRQSAR